MLSNKDTGERAFPFFDERKMNVPEYGLTIRDYFAAKALPVAWKAFEDGYYREEEDSINSSVAACAYQMADAMIEARYK